MRRDRIANEKVIDFLSPVTRVPGTVYTAKFDTQTSQTSVGGSREALTNLLLMILMGDWGVGGTVNITVQHCQTQNGTYTTHSTIAQMLQSEDEDLYLAEVKNFYRYIRLMVVFAGAICDVAIVGTGNRSRRERVVQLGTEKTVTKVY